MQKLFHSPTLALLGLLAATASVGGTPVNLSEGQTVVVSSTQSPYVAANAVDGNGTTRWGSSYSDNQWIYVDLGETASITEVVLDWETAYGTQYDIQVSDNASSWTTVYSETSGNGGLDEITLSTSGRYVRMLGIDRATHWGYSLWEFEVWGTTSSGSIISEDFSSGASNFTAVAGGTWSVSGGRYVLSSPATGPSVGVLGNISVHNTSLSGDYVVTALMNINATSSEWNDAVIVFGYQDLNNYYYVSLNESNDGNTKGVFKVVSGVPTELADISITVVASTDYPIQIQRTGSSIVVLVNSSQVASVTDATFSGGLVGFGTYNDGAQFDDLVVTGSADTIAPTVPTGLATSNVTTTTVDLDWNASTDAVGVTGYTIYLSGESPIEIGNTTSVTVEQLTPATSYTVAVSASDAAGNESSQSTSVGFTTAAGSSTIDAFSQIEAEDFDAQTGLGIYSGGTGQKIGSIENGTWARYDDVNFGAGATGFSASTASATSGGTIQLRLDSTTGTLIGSATVSGTGGWDNFTTINTSVSGATGVHDLYLVFVGGSGALLDVDYFVFTSGASQVAAPQFSPAGGSYSSAQNVTITSSTSGATIRYTTNGTNPTSTSGTIYSSPVSISSTSTLKAIAYKSGMTDSSVSSAVYTIIPLQPAVAVSQPPARPAPRVP